MDISLAEDGLDILLDGCGGLKTSDVDLGKIVMW